MNNIHAQDVQKGIHYTRPPQARQDAPLPGQGRSERKGEAYFGYVEPLSEARTTLEAFFNILSVGGRT